MIVRLTIASFVLLSATLFVGCAHRQGESALGVMPFSWTDHTILTNAGDITALNVLANNPAASRDERAKAIFTLFAQHIRPGATSVEVHKVLNNTNWFGDTTLHGIYFLGGWIPVDMSTTNNTAFCLHLFPIEKDKFYGPWMIFLNLSPNGPNDTRRSEAEAIAFLRGDTSLYGSPTLAEFALCFPYDPADRYGGPTASRIERFSRQGIHVYGLPRPSN